MPVNIPSKANQMPGDINSTLLNPEISGVLFRRKRILRPCCHARLKMKMNPTRAAQIPKICSKHLMTAVPSPTSCDISSYYQQNYSYPLIGEFPQFQLTVPIPVVTPTPTPLFAQQMCPYASSLYQPIVSPIVQAYVPEDLSSMSFNTERTLNYSAENYSDIGSMFFDQAYYSPKMIVPEDNKKNSTDNESETKNVCRQVTKDDLIEVYLSLPKDLFPPARLFTLDPNPIIDEFCKMADIQHHAPWLLDMEFGIPKLPITRPIPIYNVKFNSIHCKNAPDAIHPSFEVCDPDFKRVLLFYYDCIVSSWYRGYISMNYDRSVENFQSWLLLPMLVFGMCWP